MALISDFVAIDVGSYSMKFAYAKKNEDGKLVLKTLALRPIPLFERELTEDQLETMSREDIKNYCTKNLRQFLTTNITELLYENEITIKDAVTFASNRDLTIRCIETPPVAKTDDLDNMINIEANKQMPFSTGNAILGYRYLGDVIRNEKALSQFIVGALQKESVENIYQDLRGAGIQIKAILSLPQSLELAFKDFFEQTKDSDKNVAVIHCGNLSTSVMVYKKAKLQFYREIKMGGEMITEAIFEEGELDGEKIAIASFSDATEYKHRIGILPPDKIEQLKGTEKYAAKKIFEVVEKLFQHIQLSISFYISQTGENRIEEIVLSGGSASMKNFSSFIEESLEVPTSLINPFKDVLTGEKNFDQELQTENITALNPLVGVLKYSGEPEIIDFLNSSVASATPSKQQGAKKTGKKTNISFDFKNLLEMNETKLRIIALIIIIFLASLITVPSILIRRKVSALDVKSKKLEDSLTNLKSKNIEVTQLLSDQRNLAKYGVVSAEVEKYKSNYSPIILELLSLTPEKIFLTKLDFGNDLRQFSIKIEGNADNSESVFDYMQRIGKSDYFDNPLLESTKEVLIDRNNYFVSFSLSCKVIKTL